MSRRNKDKGRLAPLVPVTKDTMKTPAWKALSHGARSLYIALKGRYNSRLQNAVYISSRVAVEELGLHSHRDSVLRWFRELQYYGFIVMVSLPHHGLNGHGKAAHYRLTVLRESANQRLSEMGRRAISRTEKPRVLPTQRGKVLPAKKQKPRSRRAYHLGTDVRASFRQRGVRNARKWYRRAGHISGQHWSRRAGHN